jgi:hypothetical protein
MIDNSQDITKAGYCGIAEQLTSSIIAEPIKSKILTMLSYKIYG